MNKLPKKQMVKANVVQSSMCRGQCGTGVPKILIFWSIIGPEGEAQSKSTLMKSNWDDLM